MSFKLGSRVFFVLVLFLVVVWPAAAVRPQETARTLEKVPLKNEPVEIAEVKVGNKIVTLGQGFIANDDWVSDLSFKVKNLSIQAVVRVELELQFPEVTFDKAALVIPIAYGQIPGLADSGPKEEIPVGPNDTVQMALGSDTYGRLKRILTDNGRTLGVTKARLQLAMIIFADGTAWRNGFLLNRDPNNPRRWIRISNTVGSIKTTFRMAGLFASIPRVGFRRLRI